MFSEGRFDFMILTVFIERTKELKNKTQTNTKIALF